MFPTRESSVMENLPGSIPLVKTETLTYRQAVIIQNAVEGYPGNVAYWITTIYVINAYDDLA